jgi:hypothetical protein
MMDAPVPLSGVLVQFAVLTALTMGAGLLTRSRVVAAVAVGRLLIVVVVVMTLLSNSMEYQWGIFADTSDCTDTFSDWVTGGILIALDLVLLAAYLLVRRRGAVSVERSAPISAA